MDNSKSGYIGRISQNGSQSVQAPNQVKGNSGKTIVTTGSDLRQGRK